MNKRFVIIFFAILSSFGTACAQEQINEFVVNVDENHNPMTLYSSYGATPNDGVVIVNSTIPGLEFNIPAAPGRIRMVPDKKKNRYVLIIKPNDNNYKQYTITVNAKGFLQGKIDHVVVKAGVSSGFVVNPKHKIINVPTYTNGGHEYKDLGLPSGTLWATCNVGATSPEGNGNYYAWGEVYSKGKNYNWNNYKFVKNGNIRKVTKYSSSWDPKYAYRRRPDDIKTLEACDDVATFKWGVGWKIPTEDQWKELKEKCRWTWTSGGYEVVGPNGNSIFLPVAGAYKEKGVVASSWGNYWSSTLDVLYAIGADGLVFNSDTIIIGSYSRYQGLSVRPVCSFRK